MNIYSGIYSWDGKRHDKDEPVAWFPGSYNLKIFDLSQGKDGVKHLKPYLCIYSETGEGMSISEHPDKFVRHICTDFDLEMDKVTWVEEVQADSGKFEMVVFEESGKLGTTHFYRIQKREPMQGEKKIIEKELASLK